MNRKSGSTRLSGSAPTTMSSSPSRRRPIRRSGKPVSTVKRDHPRDRLWQMPAQPRGPGTDAGMARLPAGDADNLGARVGQLRLDELGMSQQRTT
jgi:hypothetical protein